jgi:hypothetical protein
MWISYQAVLVSDGADTRQGDGLERDWTRHA